MTPSDYGVRRTPFATIAVFGRSVGNGESLARILIIDDMPEMRQLLCDFVSIENHEGEFEVVGEGGDGRVGVRLVEELRPDVVILDWQMPVLDGLAAAPLMKDIDPALVIVMFSSRGSYGAEEALAAGVDSYVDKERGPSTVVAEIRRLIGRRVHGPERR